MSKYDEMLHDLAVEWTKRQMLKAHGRKNFIYNKLFKIVKNGWKW